MQRQLESFWWVWRLAVGRMFCNYICIGDKRILQTCDVKGISACWGHDWVDQERSIRFGSCLSPLRRCGSKLATKRFATTETATIPGSPLNGLIPCGFLLVFLPKERQHEVSTMMPTTSWVPVSFQTGPEKMPWSPAMRIPLSMPLRLKADSWGWRTPKKKIRLLSPFS